MVLKKICDVCGVELSYPPLIDPENIEKHIEGSFTYSGVVSEVHYDLCRECGAKVRDFIRQLNKEKNSAGAIEVKIIVYGLVDAQRTDTLEARMVKRRIEELEAEFEKNDIPTRVVLR
jgi:hypothetical protein